MAEKQLIVVVDGTDALRPYWKTLLSEYLHKIIRCFCGNQLMNGQKLSEENPAFALVLFNSHAPYSAFLVQRTGWTKDLDVFLCWLSRIPFSGGGYGDAAIAEGLSDALKMFPILTNGTQSHQNLDSQKHCILVSASNPYSLPTYVCSPALSTQLSENPEAQTGTCLDDAEGVAKSFGQSFISLSVICPRRLPKLRAIYNAGRRNPRAADPTIDIAKNSHFIVLISENFMEARAVLSHPLMGNLTTNQGIVEPDVLSSSVVPRPSSTSIPSVNGSIINRQQSPLGTIPFATGKVEPTAVPPMVFGSGYPYLPPISSVSSQGVSSLQTSSQSPTSQEINVTNEVIQAPSLMNELGPTSVSSAPATMNPTSGVNPYTLWIKIWKGSLSGQSRRYPNFRLYLEGYGDSSTSKMLVADWPSSMQIRLLIGEKNVNWKHYVGKADILAFQILTQKEFFARLQEKKLCVVIKLPSQTLLLSVLDKAERLRGILFPGHKVILYQKILRQK